MKCSECDADMVVTVKDHHYIESGLPSVYLRGVEVRTCPNCGEQELAIRSLAQLHRVIAELIADKAARLTGAEIRFLRKYLGWSAEDFARTIGVRPETVSRWENEREPMGATAERLLRLMALRSRPVDSYPNERLADVATDDAQSVKLELQSSRNGWKVVEALAHS